MPECLLHAPGRRSIGAVLPRRPSSLVLLALAVLLALCGCGDDPTVPSTPPDDGWSEGDGGPAPGVDRGEKQLMARLLGSLEAGEAPGSATWQASSEALAELLWPQLLEGGSLPPETARAVSTQGFVLTIAADIAARLVREGRDALVERHPIDVEVHDRVRAALAAGPMAWRAFVTDEAPHLLERKRAALERELTGR